MTVTEWIFAILAFAAAVGLIILGIRSFQCRGKLLNNAYFYASEKERETMDKKPYYRQTAVVFFILSGVFLMIGASVVLQNSRINLLELPLILAAVIYAVVSTVRFGKQEKNQDK
jgi:hypothetical protein